MPELEGESTNKFKKLIKPLTKTPWRSFKSMLSKTFKKKTNGNNAFKLPPVRYELGAVYEKNLASETGIPVPTNRGGLDNYMRNLDEQNKLLSALIEKLSEVKDSVERRQLKNMAKDQKDRIWKLKQEIRTRGLKKIANTMATNVKGTLLSANGETHVKKLGLNLENRTNALHEEINEGVNNIQKELNKQTADLDKVFGVNETNVMPSQLPRTPNHLPLAPLNVARTLPPKLNLRVPNVAKGGKTRRANRRR